MNSLLIFGICIIALPGLVFQVPSQANAETMGSIAVSLSYSNGDIANYFPVSLKIYQDSSTVPYREIESLPGNPFNIVSLPTGHQYKIVGYVDGLHATDSYVNLQKSHEDLNIILPLSGGMRLNVFYNDGVTPIPNATVNVISLDNKTWAKGSTNINGQTLRFWLEPTDFESDHYLVNVRVGSHLVYSQSPVFLLPGKSQEIKVVTNWPPVINSLITIKLLDANQNPLASNGNLTVDAYDSSGDMISQSPVTIRGEAYFSNFKVGDYQFKAKTNDNSVLASLNATLDGSRTTFVLHEIPKVLPQTNSTTTSPQPSRPSVVSCNCVAFRIDNIQDYWLDNVQAKVIDTFYQKNAKQTLGIIANAFGNDSKLVDQIKAESGDMDIAINGWDFEDFTALDMKQQSLLLDQSKQKISSLFGVTPSVFIPPYGKADSKTFYAMSNSSILFLSASPDVVPPTSLGKKIHLFSPNVILGDNISTNETDLSKIKNAIRYQGFAVATLSFQDYAQNNGTDKINLPDAAKIQGLGDIIDKIRNDGISIVTIKGIWYQAHPRTQIPLWMKNTAAWWAQGKVDDGDFVKEVQYLMEQGILKIPQTLPATQPTPGGIKNTAGLWAGGQASDDEFGKAIWYMISNGTKQ